MFDDSNEVWELNRWLMCTRQLLRLAPFSFERLERAFYWSAARSNEGGSASSGLPDLDPGSDPGATGPAGQARLLRDIHIAMLRLLEGQDVDLQEPATLAGYGPADDRLLAPQAAYK